MNECIVSLLRDSNKSAKLARGLPKAFEMAGLELPSKNPAVGFLREHIVIGFFLNEFGADNIQIPNTSTERGYDVAVCGGQLSIKTVTGGGKIRMLWTPDTYKVGGEVKVYTPEYDLFLVHINWGQCKDGVYYIPREVQCIIHEANPKDYLHVPVGTNHRGPELTTSAKNALLKHHDTIRLKVDWKKHGLDYTPYNRWEKFWEKI
jgi:hypothetical protein